MGKSKELAELGQVVTQSGGYVGFAKDNPIYALHLGGGSNSLRRTFIEDTSTPGQNAGHMFQLAKPDGSTTSAGYYFQPQDGNDSFLGLSADNINYHLKVNQSGHVTMPYQPSFAAYVDGTGLTAGFTSPTTPVPYQWDHVNVGGHYNTTTSTFTAPTAGTYVMNASASFGNNSVTNKWVAIRFVVNGSVYYSNGYALDSVQVGPNYNSYGNVSLSDIFYLNANDTVCVQAQYNTFNGNLSFGCFSGYLLG